MIGPRARLLVSISVLAALAAAGSLLWLHLHRPPPAPPPDRRALPISHAIEVRDVPEAKRAG
jgi:hypothetical protein